MIGAFTYLAGRSAWNRFARQLRRLRTPRYFFAVLLGLLYLWAIVEQQRTVRSGADQGSAGWVELIAALGVAGVAAWAWVFASDRRVLSFTPADVTFLFPGPVTRRWLVAYKLVRAQLAVLFNVLLWTLLLSREHFGVSPWLRALSLWVLLTTLSLHRLSASFVRSSLKEHRGTGVRRNAWMLLAAAAAITVLAVALWHESAELSSALRDGDADALVAALTVAVLQSPLKWLLVPFQLLVRPLTAPTEGAWTKAIWPALGILALHFLWVFRADAAFEESAAEHAIARTRRETPEERARNALAEGARRRLPRVLHLRSSGWPAGAILWKNLVSVVRVRPIRGLVIGGMVAGAALAWMSFGSGRPAAEIVATFAMIWAVLMLLLGPQWIRNDLRNDLPSFDLLRSYPVRGRSVIAAEVAGSALVLTIIQLSLLVFAYLAVLGNDTILLSLQERSLGLLAAAVYLPQVNYAAMLIQNGGAILFPAWVSSATDRAGGVEALGQNMLLIVTHLGMLIVLLIVPATVASGVYYLFRPAMGEWAEIARAATAISIVVFESRAIVGWLGKVYERTDPVAVAVGG